MEITLGHKYRWHATTDIQLILFIYTTFIKRSIHKQTCSNALFNK